MTLVVAACGLGLADWAYRRVGSSVFPGGALDETAHFLTMLLVLWAIGRRASDLLGLSALVASVAIDLDHLPSEFGIDWLTTGTPRPHTHSLLTLGVLLVASMLWRRRRLVLVGCALGVSVHFVRDLAESGTGVSLLWPWSNQAFTIPHGVYLGAVALLIAMSAVRGVSRQRSGRAQAALPPA